MLSLCFMKGSVTFLSLSLAGIPGAQADVPSAVAVADASQQAGLPQKMQFALQEEGVYLPAGVSVEVATSAQFFVLAQQHRMSAGLWVKVFALRKALLLLMQQLCLQGQQPKAFVCVS